jgi:hypothetical protein
MVDVKLNPEKVKRWSVVARNFPLIAIWTYWVIVVLGGFITLIHAGTGPDHYVFKQWLKDLGVASVALAIVYAARDISRREDGK